jgi:excisionase family DNA binding protein
MSKSDMPQPEREVFSIEQAAQFLGVQPKTLRSAARSLKIPSYRIGQDLRFLRTELIAFLRSARAFDANGQAVTNPITKRAAKSRRLRTPRSFNQPHPSSTNGSA